MSSVNAKAVAGTGNRNAMKGLLRHSDICMALGLIAIIVVMVIPLPTFLLDICLALSIALSLAILLTALYVEEPLKFSVFPGLLLVTTLVTAFFVWRFTQPIKDLSIAARRVASGNFDVQVPAERRDEMGTLAASFNEMTARLGRARELETQLHQAEKGAVVGRLAAAIAHEIRNPLDYINLTLDHLRSSFAPTDQNKRATFVKLTEQLKTEVARINRHISDFLKYSRPSKLELQNVDIRAEAEDALRLVEVRAEECGIKTNIVHRARC